jgi:signal transduction histidine kinase
LRLAEDLPHQLDRLADRANALRHEESALSHDARAALHELSTAIASAQRNLVRLRELHAIEARSRAIELSTVNVGAVLVEAAGDVRALAESRQVRVSLPAPGQTALARADAAVLRKVIESLLSSAIVVSPAGSAVALALWQAEDRVLITVSDEGPGLAVADKAQLLSQSRPPFGEQETSPHYGLALVHNWVQAMQGWLWHQSEPGRGATLVIELPLPEGAPPTRSSAKK